jgi:hypothetical protein
MLRHALVVMFSLCPALAAAQSASETKAAADALFDEGKRLLAAGDLDHACPKFEASLQVLDQLGVRLNLADCHERQGRTATAWAEFREAASQADKRGDARAGYARQRTDALSPRLVKLQIAVPTASLLPGLVVRREGAPVPSAMFDAALPVNPGAYTIEASAPGYQAWSKRVEITQPGAVVTVEIPRLNAAHAEPPRVAGPGPAAGMPRRGPPADPPADPAPIDEGARHRRHVLAIGVGAGGVAALAAGVVLGLEARSKWNSVGAHCNAEHLCDPTGAATNRDARTLGNIGTVVGSVGVAALIAGTVLYATAPAARPVLEHARLDVDRRAGVRVRFVARF